MNVSTYSSTLRRSVVPGLVLATTLNLSGCAAARMSMKYGELKTQTELSESVFLELRTDLPQTVYVSESCSATRDVTIKAALERDLMAAGYEVVSSAEEATYILQVNHLRVSEVELSGDETLGDAIGASVAAGATSAFAADLLGADDAAGAVGLVAGLAAFIIDAKTVHLAHTLTTDVLLTEAMPGVDGSSEPRYHTTQVTSGASKVNLEWDESLPQMVNGVSSTLSRLLPSASR